jgi:hypothetical protein
MALKSPGSGQRARANPTEAEIPDNLLDYRDPSDRRWRGDKPYIGLGNAVRNTITEDLRTSVRWMLPGDLLDWSGLLRWADAHFPGYDPDLYHGVYEEVGDAIDYLIKHGFLQRCNQENPGFIRTDKPPQVAYSVFGNGAVKYQLKRIAADREMLRGDITAEVVNTAYAEGPTREQFLFLNQLEQWEKHGLTDADFMNPSPELLAKVEARNEHYRLIREKSAAKLAETKRCHALIERHKQAYLASPNTDWAPALQKLLANRGLSLPAYVRQQRREDETYIDALARVLDGIETKTPQEESAPWE